jgi:dTDP-4-amino-4,6-dideoxygalactose transaminase
MQAQIPLIETKGQQTNFGPNFWNAKRAIDELLKRQSLPVSTGTAALQLGCQVTFQRGTAVAVPDFTMVATLHAVVAAGCKPIIVPCDPDSGMVNLKTLQELAKWGGIQGAVVVSPFGATFDHTAYEALGIRLVYDLAGAFPMAPSTKWPVAYSCHATKNISTREGGFVTFATCREFEEARKLSCFSLDETRTAITIHAGNHKMDEARCQDLFCAVKYGMDGIHARIRNKRRLARFYASSNATPLVGLLDGFPSLCVMKVPDAQRLQDFGDMNGVTFKRYYHPLLSDMAFREKIEVIAAPSPDLRRFIAFPSDATDEQALRVVEVVKEAFA